MITCFIHPVYEKKTSPNLDEEFEKIIHYVVLSVFFSIPCINFIYGIIEAVLIYQNITSQNDRENKSLFYKYCVYIGTYIILTFLMFALYFWAFWNPGEPKPFLRWSSYIITLSLVSTPLLVGFFRFIQVYVKSDKIARCCNKRPYPRKSDMSGSLLQEVKSLEFDQFEKKAMKKFVSNIYIAVCYCLERSKVLTGVDITINEENCQETNEYKMNKDIVTSQSTSKIGGDAIVQNSEGFSITCIEFAPKIFSYLRRIDNVDENELIFSFLPMNNTQGIKESEGRSGNFFINTDDKQFILKTISFEDVELIRSLLLEKMANHFKTHSDSIIGRIYGLYKLKIKTGIFSEDEIYFILMKNVFGTFYDNVLCKYDLKGSALNRKVELDAEKIDQEVMKDINFLEIEGGLMLNDETTKKLMTVSANDVTFLASLGIMDYSLLVVKLSLNKDEIVEVFGKYHKKKTEAEISILLGETSELLPKDKEEEKKEEEVPDTNLNIDNVRFQVNQIGNLKKYIFPSLKADVAYIIAIIDFFQLYDLRKNLETQFKRFKADKRDISSVPPEEYVIRFINNLSKITNGKQLLKNANKDPLKEYVIIN